MPARRAGKEKNQPLRPVGLYAASKVWGEEFGRECASQHQLSVLCLRFGRVNPENRPTQPYPFGCYCWTTAQSHNEAHRLRIQPSLPICPRPLL